MELSWLAVTAGGFARLFVRGSTIVSSTASTTVAAVVFALSFQEYKRKKRVGTPNEEIMQMIFLRPPPTHIMCQGQVYKLATLPQRREFEPEEYIYIRVLDCGCQYQTQVYERLPQESPGTVGQTPQSSTVYESLPQESPGTVGQTSQTTAEAVMQALERGGNHPTRRIERSCSLPIELDSF
ncbi:hypothetical protein V6N13_102489 [Hibiscus sabdariffa]